MISRLVLGVALSLILSVAPSWSEPVSTSEVTQEKTQAGASMALSVDKTNVGIAERLRYVLVVEADADLNADFDGVGDRFGEFQVVERSAFGPIVLADQRVRWQREYLLVPTDVGTAVLPALSVAFLPSKNACVSADDCELSAHGRRSADYRAPHPAFVLSTDPIDVLVDTILPPDVDLTQPRDVLAPLSIGSAQAQVDTQDGWGWALAGLATLLLVAFGFMRGRNSALIVEESGEAAIDPAMRALRALADLRSKGPPAENQLDDYCSRQHGILRTYLDEGFAIPASELTNSELTRAIKQREQLQSQHQNFEQLLNHADLARFGHQYPSASQSLEMIDLAENVVRATASAQAT